MVVMEIGKRQLFIHYSKGSYESKKLHQKLESCRCERETTCHKLKMYIFRKRVQKLKT